MTAVTALSTEDKIESPPGLEFFKLNILSFTSAKVIGEISTVCLVLGPKLVKNSATLNSSKRRT